MERSALENKMMSLSYDDKKSVMKILHFLRETVRLAKEQLTREEFTLATRLISAVTELTLEDVDETYTLTALVDMIVENKSGKHTTS